MSDKGETLVGFINFPKKKTSCCSLSSRMRSRVFLAFVSRKLTQCSRLGSTLWIEPGIREMGGREASRTIQTLPHCRNNSAARYLRIASQ